MYIYTSCTIFCPIAHFTMQYLYLYLGLHSIIILWAAKKSKVLVSIANGELIVLSPLWGTKQWGHSSSPWQLLLFTFQVPWTWTSEVTPLARGQGQDSHPPPTRDFWPGQGEVMGVAEAGRDMGSTRLWHMALPTYPGRWVVVGVRAGMEAGAVVCIFYPFRPMRHHPIFRLWTY